jgi:DNA polymerase III subunit gamma/tau
VTYEPLHHKYRPQTFAALVGQTAIATTLTNALRQQRIAPAYLFTGARGTGKTSSARIFAKSLNCLASDVPTENPCGVCETCRSIAGGYALDVIEIDAASNTGVDHIRELIERSQFAPVQCRYKVYVVDECHMLSTAAFNALLKTLEEPPDRVVFVLATTDPQRVLPTIISRCQRFDFRRIPLEDMVSHLAAIAQQEQISIDPDAIQLIAQISQGGMRDAESLLDQLSLTEGQITIDRVWDLVGAVPERNLLELVRAIAQDNAIGVLEVARQLMDRGREPLIVLQNLASFYRDLLIAKTAPDRNDLVSITPPTWVKLCQFVQEFDLSWILMGQRQLRSSELQVKTSTQPRLWLEVTLMGLLPSANYGQANGSPPNGSPPNGSQSVAGSQERSISQPSAIPAQSQPTLTPSAPIQPKASPPLRQERSPGETQPLPELADSEQTPPQQQAISPAEPVAKVTDEQAELSQIWQQVLGLVQPFSTRTMLKQQCHLIAFGGQEARIGTKSQKLFRMAQERMPNIEAAFTQLCHQSVRVSLEVVIPGVPQAGVLQAGDASETAASSQPSSSTVFSDSAVPPVIAPPSDHPANNIGKNSGVSPSSSPSTNPADADLRSTPTPSPQDPSVSPLDHSISPTAWQEEDEVTRAAKSLAQMFNGQIVAMDGEVIETNSTVSPSSSEFAFGQPELDPTEERDEEDVDEEDEDEELPF